MRLVPVLLLVSATAWAAPSPVCHLRFDTTAKTLPDGKIHLQAIVLNLTGKPVQIVLPERCPAGPIAFSGIRPHYDFYGTCTMGACQPLAPEQKRMVPKGRQVLGGTTFNPVNGGCGQEAPAGSYKISWPKPKVAEGVKVCGSFEVTVQIKGAPGETPPPAPAPKSKRRQCENVKACDLACPDGKYQVDEYGCEMCACEKGGGLVK